MNMPHMSQREGDFFFFLPFLIFTKANLRLISCFNGALPQTAQLHWDTKIECT